MKKVLFTIAAAVMMFAANSCKKESINEPEVMHDPKANEFLAAIDGGGMVQNAPSVNDGMNTMATFNPNDKLQVLWQRGDVIKVNGIDFTCTTYPLDDGRAYFENNYYKDGFHADVYHAFYSTSVSITNANNSGTLNECQYYNPVNQAENLPMYATSTDHWLNFSNICAAIKIYVPCTAHHIVISNTSAPMNGGFTVQGNKAVMDNASAQSLSDNEKKITIYKKGTQGQTTDFHACDSLFIAIPEGTYAGLQIAFYENNGDATPIYTTGGSNNPLTVTANHIYRIVGYKYTNLLPGKFRVGTGPNDYVKFTTGNLWKDGSSSYHFENNQTDYPTEYDANYIGHFTDLVTTEVDGIAYDALNSSEFSSLINYNRDLVSFAQVDNVLCVLVAPDGATAFNPTRDSYTLKEVNSMGLLCLPFAGNCAQGKVFANSGNPKDNQIWAKYWESDTDDSGTFRSYISITNNTPFNEFGENDIIEGCSSTLPTSVARPIRLVKRP
ncbi:MAG: hypothetical protein MJ002_01975 [Paludibacteraceae bacterium]|nr:hypothetical protein [Paludibacteraceae bacterium]